MIESIQRLVQDACLSALGLIGGVCILYWISVMARRFLARSRAIGLTALLALAAVAAVIQGGGKSDWEPQSNFPPAPQAQLVPFSPDVGLTGHVQSPAVQSPRASAAMPFRAAKWNIRGAWNDSFRYAFADGWEFPFGTGHLDRVEVCSQGRVIPCCGSTNVIAGIGVPLQILNPTTSFGCGYTDRNSYIFSWTNAVVGRVLHEDAAGAETIDASIELFRSGDVAITTNGVTELIPRVHPADADGDGIPDVIDPSPSVCDGDFFGPHGDLPENANTNAYCWVDIVVSNADAEVVFEGDGPSDLPDPHFMARAGATNRVTILIGKGYAVRADEQIACVGTSDPAVEVARTGWNSLYVRWPVEVTLEDGASPSMQGGAGHGITRALNVAPDFLGGEFAWTSSHCCEISMAGLSLTWTCSGSCGCGGCHARGLYAYEGYGLEVSGGTCGCPPSPTPPGESPSLVVSFSEDALFYEEAYTNQPGDVVGRRASSNATFTCTAYGGRHGGALSLATANFDRLAKIGGDDLPTAPAGVAPYETRTWSAEYAPLVHSGGANDIAAIATFTEALSGNVTCATAATTVVKLTLTPWVTRQGCDHRHIVGVREIVRCIATPNVGHLEKTGGGRIFTDPGENYICPLTSDNSVIHYDFGSSRYDFDLTIIEPNSLVARLPYSRDFGVATNHAGGAGMNLRIYVSPETVAFNGIAMEEIPSLEGVHQGYFSNIAFSNIWYHTTEMWAGRWKNIKSDNFWDVDKAWMGIELPRELPNGDMTYNLSMGEWSEGLLVWQIPWGWGELNSSQGDPPVKTMTVRYDQTFTFDEHGMLTVSKFQHTVSRGTNNVIRLDGDIVVGTPLTEEEINEANGND